MRREHMGRARERGVALAAAVAGMAVVATLAVGVGRWALAGARIATSTADALQADALVRSGLAMTAVLLEDRARLGEPDLLVGPLAAAPVTHELAGGVIEVRIEDAARRLDLGAPELAPAVRALLARLRLDPALGDALADWIDADDAPRPHGAEREWYLGRRPALVPANAPLHAVAELGCIRGWDAATVARIQPFVATTGERVVNPNTAPAEVLAAWLGSDSMASALLERRARGPVACAGMPACAVRSAAFLVTVEGRVHGAVRAVEATVWVPPLGRAEVRSVRPSAPQERGQAEGLA
jgi:general secretion pathway protein K